MMKTVVIALALGIGAASAQTPPGPTFDVASVKASGPLTSLSPADIQSGKFRIGINVLGSRVEVRFVSLMDLIRTAYDVKPFQISGPDWMRAVRFDIVATMPEAATRDQVNPMLRALLAERFKLTVHHEQQERPVYALVVGKDGPKLKPSAPDADEPKSDTPPSGILVNGQSVAVNADGRGATVTGGPTGPAKVSITPAGEHIEAQKITIAALADIFSQLADRPVVDMSGLTGTYQVTLDIPMEELRALAMKAAQAAGISLPAVPAPPGGAGAGGGVSMPADPSGTSVFKSVQQLGLKLEPRRAPVDVIVIDHVEKTPTED